MKTIEAFSSTENPTNSVETFFQRKCNPFLLRLSTIDTRTIVPFIYRKFILDTRLLAQHMSFKEAMIEGVNGELRFLHCYTTYDLMQCMNEYAVIKSYSLAELCVMADLQLRTVRYYIQIGLVDRPHGSTRAAAYGTKHLEQLLLIKKWTTAGVSLDRIRELLQGADAPVPPRPVRSGQIEVKSHIQIIDGLEVVIDPSRAGLTTDEVRELVKGVMAAYQSVMEKKAQSEKDSASSTDQKS